MVPLSPQRALFLPGKLILLILFPLQKGANNHTQNLSKKLHLNLPRVQNTWWNTCTDGGHLVEHMVDR